MKTLFFIQKQLLDDIRQAFDKGIGIEEFSAQKRLKPETVLKHVLAINKEAGADIIEIRGGRVFDAIRIFQSGVHVEKG